jgi:tRNA nucleotidyltransferase (CCA-adding enzyme)
LADALRDLALRAARRGQRAAVVGGCVRDALLGRATRDLDVMAEGDASALAADCAAAWGARIETFGRFGTARLVLSGGFRLDVATARAETYPAPGALPVVRPASLEEDLARRDFTVNAMAVLAGPDGLGETLDPFGGARDLKAKVLRILHPKSFVDDPTRLLRAARYAARLGLSPEPATLKAMKSATGLGAVSRERIRQELWRILEEADPVPPLKLCLKWGLAAAFHPKFKIPDGLARHKDPRTRLGLIAFGLEKDGEEFVRSLPLPREDGAVLAAALRADRAGATPAQSLPEAVVRLLRAARPTLSKAAVLERFITGSDLLKAGLTPGPRFAAILEEAARAQWSGELKNAAAAKAFLRRSLRREK